MVNIFLIGKISCGIEFCFEFVFDYQSAVVTIHPKNNSEIKICQDLSISTLASAYNLNDDFNQIFSAKLHY